MLAPKVIEAARHWQCRQQTLPPHYLLSPGAGIR